MTIVFYDGDCGLCQRSIAVLVQIDKKNKLQYAPLNGKTFIKIYGQKIMTLSTVKVYSNGKTFEKSSAFFEVCRVLGGKYRLFLLLKIFPKFFCDFVYDQIASGRQSISCIKLDKKKYFLD